MLEAKNLTKKFKDRYALDNLNLSVGPGEIFCLLGANGAGKTTTINLFLGFTNPTSGTATVSGINVAQYTQKAREHIAYLPEQVMLYRNLTGMENLEYFSALSERRRPERQYLLECLRQTGLPTDAFDRRIGTYSKGMRQKVGIAIALAKQASVLLLDEPTSGLDPEASNDLSHLLENLREKGTTILMATHDLFRARESGTYLGIMKQGKLKETLRASEVSSQELEEIYLEFMRGTNLRP